MAEPRDILINQEIPQSVDRNQRIFNHLIDTGSTFIEASTLTGERCWVTELDENRLFPTNYSNNISVTASHLLCYKNTFLQISYNRLEGFSPELLITDPSFLTEVLRELGQSDIQPNQNYNGRYSYSDVTVFFDKNMRRVSFKPISFQDSHDQEAFLDLAFGHDRVKPQKDIADQVIEMIDNRVIQMGNVIDITHPLTKQPNQD